MTFVYKGEPHFFTTMIFFEHCIRWAATFHGCATRCNKRECRKSGRCWIEVDYDTGEGACGGRISEPVIRRAAEYATVALDMFHEDTLNDARRRRHIKVPPLDPELERCFRLEGEALRFYRREWFEMEAREKAFADSVAAFEREAAARGEPVGDGPDDEEDDDVVDFDDGDAIEAMEREAEEHAARGAG
jgi:hypothetical protein